MSLPDVELIGSTVLVCFLIPLAILVSRDRLRKYRRGLLLALETLIYKENDHRPMTAFEVARIKYEMEPHDGTDPGNGAGGVSRGSMLSFALPAAIYAGLASSVFVMALFLTGTTVFWLHPNLILSGLKTFSGPEMAEYQMRSAVLVTAGFLGAYIFSLQFLIQRVRNYELSPTSFLIASVSLLEGCFVVAVVRHVLPTGDHSGISILLAFVLGYFPTFGISWIVDHLRIRYLKRVDPAAYNVRYILPTDMIDGVDMMTKFRLSEAGVCDVQNLATANPVLLYVETPYNLLTILDWMAQAQLIAELGSDAAGKLRKFGIRGIRDVSTALAASPMREVVVQALWSDIPEHQPDLCDQPKVCDQIIGLLSNKLHVRRLEAFMDALGNIIDGRNGRAAPTPDFAPAPAPNPAAADQSGPQQGPTPPSSTQDQPDTHGPAKAREFEPA